MINSATCCCCVATEHWAHQHHFHCTTEAFLGQGVTLQQLKALHLHLSDSKSGEQSVNSCSFGQASRDTFHHSGTNMCVCVCVLWEKTSTQARNVWVWRVFGNSNWEWEESVNQHTHTCHFIAESERESKMAISVLTRSVLLTTAAAIIFDRCTSLSLSFSLSLPFMMLIKILYKFFLHQNSHERYKVLTFLAECWIWNRKGVKVKKYTWNWSKLSNFTSKIHSKQQQQQMRRMWTSAHQVDEEKRKWWKKAPPSAVSEFASLSFSLSSLVIVVPIRPKTYGRDQSEAHIQLAAINRVTRNDGDNQPQAFCSQREPLPLQKVKALQTHFLSLTLGTECWPITRHTSSFDFFCQECVCEKDAACLS